VPAKGTPQQAKQPRRIGVLHGLARPALRKAGTTPQTTQRSLALPAFFCAYLLSACSSAGTDSRARRTLFGRCLCRHYFSV
jgi:hypothetical protein